MLFKRFYEEEGFEPSAKQIVGEYKAYLRKMFSNMPFFMYRKVYKVSKTVLSGITK
jgi:hypothetical protein